MKNLSIKKQIKKAKKEAMKAEKARMDILLLAKANARVNRASKGLTPRQEQRELVKMLNNKLTDLISLGYDKKGYFGYVTVTNMVISICNTIQFNPHEMYEDALALTGLSKYTIDEIVSAQGLRPRVNLENECVESGIPAQVDELKDLIEMAVEEMQLPFTPDLNKMSQEQANKIYKDSYAYMSEQLAISIKEASAS